MTTPSSLAALPRTLLISGTPPDPSGVGGIILADLCPLFPVGHLSVFLPVAAGQEPEIPEAVRARMTLHLALVQPAANLPALARLGRPGRGAHAALRGWQRRTSHRRLIESAVAFGLAQGVQRVWGVLDAPVSIALARPVAEALGVPLVTTVWDDIDHNTRYFQLDPLAAKQMRREFALALRSSRCCAVIGESMQSAYQRDYGVRGIVVRHGLPAELRYPAKPVIGGSDVIRIGFAGSVTARTAFETLLQALDGINWRLGDKPIELRLMGLRFDLWSRVSRRIECLGWRSVPETVRLLSECQINYLPQPFEADWAPFTRLSFPSKLTTYLGAGAPLLLHTPPEGSLHRFFSEYPFGVRCDTLEPDKLVEALHSLVDDPARYRQASATLTRTLDEAFTAERFHADFLRVLNCGTQVTG